MQRYFRNTIFKKIKLVAGANGLDRVIRWVHVIDIPQVTKWLQGGELLFITRIGISRDIEDLLQLVKGIFEKNLAGLVINTGPYISKTPKNVIDLANNLSFPVFELPWEVKLVEVTKSICSLIVMSQIEEKSIRDFI